MIRSLRFRLLFAGAILVVLALAVVWGTLSDLFRRQIAQEYERQLGAVIDTLAASAEVTGGDWKLSREPTDPRYSIPASGHYWQIAGPNGRLLRSRSLWDSALDPADGVPDRLSALVEMTGPDAKPVIGITQVITFGQTGHETRLTMTAATSRAEFDRASRNFSSRLGIMLLVTGLALIAASALQVMLGLLPLGTLTRDVARIRSGAASRMPEEGPSETRLLVREINDLLATQEKAVDKARQRASDLAHGLKTPLTVLAQIAERLSGGRNAKAAKEMQDQVTVIRQRVDRQLALARMAASRAGATDAAAATGKLVDIMRRISADSGIEWTARLPGGLIVAADATDFSEALGNVLDNARKWAKSRVEVTAAGTDERIDVVVDDDGPGVAEADRKLILERGRRLDTRASETGLGLPICGDILEAYGGSIDIDRSPLGGLRVRLNWPRHRAE